MVILSTIESSDIKDINKWPQYEGMHAQMDYAIRENGWLDTYCHNSKNYCYVAKIRGVCVGFALLIHKEELESEFRIAIHPDFLGCGYGSEIIQKTLILGFSEHELRVITLIVRKNNPMAQRLYVKHGFVLCGETKKIIHRSCIDFFVMKIQKENFIEGET